jgi:hypothetical protein
MALSTLIVINYRKLLFWIPFLPFSGIWLYSAKNPKEWMFINSYVELMLGLFMFFRYFKVKVDGISALILVTIICAVPSLLNSWGHTFLSLFLFLCLLFGLGIYKFFLCNMKEFLRSNLIDLSVLMLIFLGISIKVYISARLGESIFLQRGGGILGSNYIGGVLILLLPLVRSNYLKLLTIIFICLQVSRGLYATLFIFAFGWFVLVSKKQALITLMSVGFLLFALYLMFASSYLEADNITFSVKEFLLGRLRIFDVQDIETFLLGVTTDQRVDMWEIGRMALGDNFLVGHGLGASAWVFDSFGYGMASNFHNLYLTLLIEGGLFFFISFICLLAYLLIFSYRHEKTVFVGLFSWAFYGLFGGELYEVGGVATCGNYYYLLFVAAYLKFKRVKNGDGARFDVVLR